MNQIGTTAVTGRISATLAAVAATDLPNLAQVLALQSGTAPASHEHGAADVTDLASALPALMEDVLQDSPTLTWRRDAGHLSGDVTLRPSGGLASGVDGLAVDLGSGVNQAARGNHSHAQLHDALTLAASNTVEASLAGQELDLEVVLGEGLKLESGVAVDYGPGHAQAARGDHTHASEHEALTVLDTVTLDLGITGQLLSGTVRLDATPDYGGAPLATSARGLYVPLGTEADTPAAGDHVHATATPSTPGFMSATDKLLLDTLNSGVLPALALTRINSVEQAVEFRREPACGSGDYVGGRVRWRTPMQVTMANLTSFAPKYNQIFELELDGTLTGFQITLASGVPGSTAFGQQDYVGCVLPLSGVAGDRTGWARWKCVLASGVPLASGIDLRMNIHPMIE